MNGCSAPQNEDGSSQFQHKTPQRNLEIAQWTDNQPDVVDLVDLCKFKNVITIDIGWSLTGFILGPRGKG